ncbi:LysM peptidoglycan-binding domain-containing protein [bacterium 1XD42-8]|nr:LysM peptidoglycan-binding domain-containing protein [bacterium 1XD42-8]
MQKMQEKNEVVKIPKNVRQMGDINESYKIYMEDYVMTYIRQIVKRYGDRREVVMILLGQISYYEDSSYLFISGAVEFYGAFSDREQIQFNKEGWEKVHKDMERYFLGLDIVGWSVSKNEITNITPSIIKTTHIKYFSSKEKVVLEIELEEEKEQFYKMEQGRLSLCSGYYIYYDKNEAMQGYMISSLDIKKEKAEESAVADRVPALFREVIREKKEEVHQHKLMTYLYGASTFLLMIVFVIGITMINNYEKMNQMEETLYYISKNIEMANKRNTILEEEIKKAKEENEEKEGKDKDPQPEIAEVTEPAGNIEMEETLETTALTSPETRREYYVKEGDTLVSISYEFYNSTDKIKEICELNGITDRNKIICGQKIILP